MAAPLQFLLPPFQNVIASDDRVQTPDPEPGAASESGCLQPVPECPQPTGPLVDETNLPGP